MCIAIFSLNMFALPADLLDITHYHPLYLIVPPTTTTYQVSSLNELSNINTFLIWSYIEHLEQILISS